MSAERPRPPRAADEKASLVGFLEWHRDTLALKCAGLSPEQLAERSAPPSPMSLLGLVRHVTDVERGWCLRLMGHEDAPALYYDEQSNPDGDFDDVDPAAVEADFATWRATVERSRAIVAALPSLDVMHSHRFGELSARWILLHLIEEYARHNGHADLLRERIDGATGE